MRKLRMDGTNVSEVLGGDNYKMNIDSQIAAPKSANIYLERPVSAQNSTILEGIRDILTREVKRIGESTSTEHLNARQADILLKVTKMYQILEVEAAKEELKYKLRGESQEKLEELSGE